MKKKTNEDKIHIKKTCLNKKNVSGGINTSELSRISTCNSIWKKVKVPCWKIHDKAHQESVNAGRISLL